MPAANKAHPVAVKILIVSFNNKALKTTLNTGSNKLKIAALLEPISLTPRLNKTLAKYDVPSAAIIIRT